MEQAGMVLGQGKVIERGRVTHLTYIDDTTAAVETAGDVKFHPLGWVILEQMGGKPPLWLNSGQIKSFYQDNLPMESVSLLLA